MKTWKIVGLSILGIILIITLDFGTGYLGVFKTRTVGKTRQNAQREVFEETQSFIEGKRQELLKFYKEWKSASEEDKAGIESMVAISFANFDESKITSPELYSFLKRCKY